MTILTPAQVQEIEDYYPPPSEDWEDCWKYHFRCALARLIASHRAVGDERDDVMRRYDMRNKQLEVYMKLNNNSQAQAMRLRVSLQNMKAMLESDINECGRCGKEDPMTNYDIYYLVTQALSGPSDTNKRVPHEAERR